MERDAVEALEAEIELIKQQFCLLVQGTDEGMTLIEPKEHIKGPLEFGEPYMQAGHAAKLDG